MTHDVSSNDRGGRQALHSLVMLDELGVTTSHTKALPLMWALAENLLSLSDTITLIATHNSYLRRFASTTYALTDVLTLVKFQICEERNLPENCRDKQEVLQDLDPALFADQSFFNEMVANRRRIAEQIDTDLFT